MTRIPRGLSANRVIRAFGRAGFRKVRQKGSHVVMRRDDPFALAVIPMHPSLDTGTLARILEGAGLSVEEFIDLL